MTDNYEMQFQDIWRDLLRKYPNAKPCANPQGFVLGGQPGAGKSNLLEQISNNLDGNALIINADEFRRYHPQFDEIQAKYGDDAPKHTAEFSGKMAERVLNKALTEHYNIAIEGTFRTAETPLNTLDLMKSHGYKTAVHIQTCPKSLSWQSTILRYNAMIKAGLTPRAVDKAHHDLVCDRLPENANTVYQSGKADEFQVYSRNGLIFDDKIDNVLPSQAIKQELDGLSLQKLAQARKLFNKKLATLSDTDRQNVLVYEKDAMKIFNHESLSPNQREVLMENFYKNAADKIQNGQSLLPKAVGLENITLTSDNRQQGDEPEMDR